MAPEQVVYAQEMARERDSEKNGSNFRSIRMPQYALRETLSYGWISVSFGAELVGIAVAGSRKERVGK